MKIIIIGAGAAGCFCAIETKRHHPGADVIILESGTKPLAKVAMTGGGRCNLTNSFLDVRSTKQVYPRGEKLMKRSLKRFSQKDTMQWFENEGVRLVTQEDQCVFPKSQDAMEIVHTLTRLADRLGIRIITGQKVINIKTAKNNGFIVVTPTADYDATHVVVATGGSPKKAGIAFLDSLHLDIIEPVPSLFTFNIADDKLHALMGTVVPMVSARMPGTKFMAEGPLLITHWGLSGPAILKLSSYAARHLSEQKYKTEISVNWYHDINENDVLEMLTGMQRENQQKQLSNQYPKQFNQRHWLYLTQKAGLSAQKRWQEVGPRQMLRLAAMLTNDVYAIAGKGKFKDEFVTCGGVALSNIDINTLESKAHPGLFFAGEVLDVDAVTGGFNLQAAWSMGHIVAESL